MWGGGQSKVTLGILFKIPIFGSLISLSCKREQKLKTFKLRVKSESTEMTHFPKIFTGWVWDLKKTSIVKVPHAPPILKRSKQFIA